MSNEPTARNLWAPQGVYDATGKEWIVFWATTLPGRFRDTESTHQSSYNHRIYRTTTKGFQTFAPATLFFDPNFPADHRHGAVVSIPAELAAKLRDTHLP